MIKLSPEAERWIKYWIEHTCQACGKEKRYCTCAEDYRWMQEQYEDLDTRGGRNGKGI